MRIESNVRFSKRQVLRWLEERSFEPRRGSGLFLFLSWLSAYPGSQSAQVRFLEKHAL